MGNVVVLSGATGFLGSAIAEELMRTTDARILALVRPKASRTPYQRLESLWFERPLLREALGTRIQSVAADIERDLLAISPDHYAKLAKDATIVIHAAAEVGVTQSAERLWNANELTSDLSPCQLSPCQLFHQGLSAAKDSSGAR